MANGKRLTNEEYYTKVKKEMEAMAKRGGTKRGGTAMTEGARKEDAMRLVSAEEKRRRRAEQAKKQKEESEKIAKTKKK